MIPCRKVRNRLSQQAFRERQAAYVRNLEKQVENIEQTNDEKVLKLEAENRELRKQLLAIRQKLESITTTLSGISKAAAAAASSDESATTSTCFELDPTALMQTTRILPTTLDSPDNSPQPQTQNWVAETTSSRDVEDMDTSGSYGAAHSLQAQVSILSHNTHSQTKSATINSCSHRLMCSFLTSGVTLIKWALVPTYQPCRKFLIWISPCSMPTRRTQGSPITLQ